ncbi:TPA: AMP-binding protein [Serratia marcescens]|uniref:AMP-binding protein n=1 Tax=Serratia marcescens TaxID=615 RepID=UPI0029CF3BA8|nr:AMP-binding protein [Serratia marcescens]
MSHISENIFSALSLHANQTFMEYNGAHYSYRMLAVKMAGIAAAVNALPYRPEALVICVQNPFFHCAVMFYSAVSGIPYVPVDKGLPEQRISLMLNTLSGKKVICVDGKTKSIIQDSIGDILDIAGLDSANPISNIHSPAPDSLQYIIFTSGSTGVPKGAAVYNESFDNTLKWYRRLIDPQPGERCLIVSSLSFDLTQKNIFIGMMSGSVLHFIDGLVFDPQNIREQVNRHSFKWINCAPSAFSLIVENLSKNSLASIQTVVLGGEAINSQTLLQLRRDGVNTRFINSYGPTECADVAFWHEISDEDLTKGRIPIGKPIPGVYFEVSYEDAQRRAGELILKGICVGAGYINNEGATKNSFLRLTADAGCQRAYRTGDIVTEEADGTLAFVSRTDDQIKYRGNRIELGEIERTFRDMSEIKEVVAKLVNQDLVVFVVLSDHRRQADPHFTAFLRKQAACKLPAYSIPTQFVYLSAFPLNNSGKIDRTSLTTQLPAVSHTVQAKTFFDMTVDALRGIAGVISAGLMTADEGETVPSLDSLEIVAFSGVLRQVAEPPIKVRDIMTTPSLKALARTLTFKHGVHSIRCYPIGMDINKSENGSRVLSGKNGKIEIIAEYETPEDVIENGREASACIELPGGRVRKRIEVVNPTCKGIYFESVSETRSGAYNIPLIIQCETSLAINEMLEKFVGLLDEHEILRSNLYFNDGVLSYSLCQTLTAERIMTTPALFKTVTEEQAIKAIDKPFDLEDGYLFRVLFIKRKNGGELLFIFHHIIIDGLSLGLIREQLLSRDDKPVILSPCTLEEYYQYTKLAFEYDKSVLKEKASQLALTFTEEAPFSASYPEFQRILRVKEENVLRLRKWCRQHNLSVTSWFLSMAIFHYQSEAGRAEFNVLFPNANRNVPQVSRMIGCLVNSSLIAVRLNGISAFSALCRYVSEELIADILDHPNMPLSALLAKENVNIAFLFTAVNYQRPSLTRSPGEVYNPRPRAECGIEVQEYDDCIEVIFNGYGHPQTLRFIDSLMNSLSDIKPSDFPVSFVCQPPVNVDGLMPESSPKALSGTVCPPENSKDDAFNRRFDALCKSILGVDQGWDMPDRDMPLFECGLDSLRAINLVRLINSEFDVRYSLRQLFKDRTFANVAGSLATMKYTHKRDNRMAPSVDRIYPSQSVLLQRDNAIPGDRENIISVALIFKENVDVSGFTSHFKKFLNIHPELFIGEENARSQVCESFTVQHHGKVYVDEDDLALIHVIDALTWDGFEPHKEVLLRPHTFRLLGGKHLLYCLFHHAVWDGGSAKLFFSFIDRSLNEGNAYSSVCRSETLGRDGISAQESVDYYRRYFRTVANSGIHVSNSSFARRHGKSVSKVISDTFDFTQIDTACRKRGYAFSLRCAWEMRSLTRGLGFCGFSNMVDKRHDYGAEGKMAYLVEPLPFFVQDNVSFEEFVTLHYSHLSHLSCSSDDLMSIAEECDIQAELKEVIEVRFYFQTHWKDICQSGDKWRESRIDNHIPWDVVNSGLSVYFNINKGRLSLECRFSDDFVNEIILVKEIDALTGRLCTFLGESSDVNAIC